MPLSAKEFINLIKIMKKLRSKQGCPWDREQTFVSLRQYVIEEAYEVVDAIESGSPDALMDELGDLLMQVVFLSRIAAEKKQFTIKDVISTINRKMVRRHPHVFGNEIAKTSDDVLKKWGRIKHAEGRKHLLDGIPKKLPALLQAFRIGQKASHVGFDWENFKSVIKKMEEEFVECKKAVKKRNKKNIVAELGDVFFSLVNISRWLGVNPEFALRETNKKFKKRFKFIEDYLGMQKRSVNNARSNELDHLWEAAKKRFP
ncbi:MAG TPA: nucleoside triphosphate pyrophosphohydrolase [bacterium]